MNNNLGWMYEKFGWALVKVMLVRHVGEIEIDVPELEYNEASGSYDPVLKGGKPVVHKSKIPRWRVVHSQYMSFGETYFMHKNHCYEVRLEHECYGRGEVHVQFLDAETGNSVNFSGAVVFAEDPKKQKLARTTKHLLQIQNQGDTSPQWIWLAIGLAVGALAAAVVLLSMGVGGSVPVVPVGATPTPLPSGFVTPPVIQVP